MRGFHSFVRHLRDPAAFPLVCQVHMAFPPGPPHCLPTPPSTFSSFYYHCGYPSFHHYVLMIFLVLLGAGCLFQAPYSTGLTFRELYYYIYHLVALVQSLSHVLLAATPYCSPPGSSVRGISQARILKWVAIFSCRCSQPGDQTRISCLGRRILYH